MKRFTAEIKAKDFLFFTGSEDELLALVPDISLPPPIKENDNFHINILIDERLKHEISELCRIQIKSLIDRKPSDDPKKFQETTKNRFLNFYKKYPGWFPLIVLEYLILFRESIYKYNIELQKTKKDLTPVDRKSLRFQIGLSIARIFESIFTYQMPYFLQDVDFHEYARLFNPIFLSGSFPEYFLSDYFCYLDLKSPLWNKDRFDLFRDLLIESVKYGLKSLIGVSLTSRGVALQKTYRIIKARQADFSEDNAVEIVNSIQDDASLLREMFKHREIKKQFLTEDIPKKLSKQEFLDKLLDEFAICASRFPLSRFFSFALDAEVLRKITNYIILPDPREHPSGFADLLHEYTLYTITPPFIYDPTHIQETKEVPAKAGTETTAQESQIDRESDFDQDETVLVDIDMKELREKLVATIGQTPADTDDDRPTADLLEQSPQTEIPSKAPSDQMRVDQDGQSRFEQVTSLVDVETAIDEVRQEILTESSEKAAEVSAGQHSQESEKQLPMAASDQDLSMLNLKTPYLFGACSLPDQGELYLSDSAQGPHYKLQLTTAKKAAFKIIFEHGKTRFLAKKESNWQQPSSLNKNEQGLWTATIRRRSDSQVFFFYLADQELLVQLKHSREADQEQAEVVISQTAPNDTAIENLDEYRAMSVAEISQALLDDLITIEQYNALIAERKVSNDRQQDEEPDFVLEQGTTFCNDWQGRILNSTMAEADIKITLSSDSFDLAIKENLAWKNVYAKQAIPKNGFKGTFTKTVFFKDPTTLSDDPDSFQKIKKDFMFIIFKLVSNDYGIKFL
ncbi:hypothetical protein JXQ70_03830 [bacterium]|nr:hypothetical protein [bacterium]